MTASWISRSMSFFDIWLAIQVYLQRQQLGVRIGQLIGLKDWNSSTISKLKSKKSCIANAKNKSICIPNAKNKNKLPMQKIKINCIANAKNKKDMHCQCKN